MNSLPPTTEQAIYQALRLRIHGQVSRSPRDEAHEQDEARKALYRVDTAITAVRNRAGSRRTRVASPDNGFIETARSLAARPETDCVALLSLVINTHIQAGYRPDQWVYFRHCTLALKRKFATPEAHS